MSIIKKDFFAEQRTASVRWNKEAGAFTRRVKNGNGWEDQAVSSFAMDVWTVRYGYEVWSEGKPPSAILVPADQDMPPKPDGGRELYCLTIMSPELGYRHDLIVQGKIATDSLHDLFEVLTEIGKDEVPVVKVETVENEYGVGPSFKPVKVFARPEAWGKPTIASLD